ncbi:MAG TPA: flagellar basal body-associated FliL family protein [Pseudogracilibacillus sp.]|nr:flagellar basal body-associated FliL family protein [Pseudogracilibacillus sp.]
MSRALSTFLISFSLIILAVAIILGVYFFVGKDDTVANEEQSIDDMNEFSYETDEITTDLKDGKFVRIQFQIIADSRKAAKELEKRDFQIENILIKEISLMNEEDFTSGLTEVEEKLQENINEVMIDGEITDVYTIKKILQ